MNRENERNILPGNSKGIRKHNREVKALLRKEGNQAALFVQIETPDQKERRRYEEIKELRKGKPDRVEAVLLEIEEAMWKAKFDNLSASERISVLEGVYDSIKKTEPQIHDQIFQPIEIGIGGRPISVITKLRDKVFPPTQSVKRR